MADISKVKLPDNTEYNIKDAAARSGSARDSTKMPLAGGTFTGAVKFAGVDLTLGTGTSSSDDSGDLVWSYGNNAEKMRLYSPNTPTAKFAPFFREFKSDGTSLYSGNLVLGDGTGASGTWGISISGNADTATSATTANKLATARAITLGGDLTGSANFDGSGNITITANNYYCSVSGGNKANYPWHRFAYAEGKSGTYSDTDAIFDIKSNYIDGPYGRIKVSFRTNGANSATTCKAIWLYRVGFDVDAVKVARWGVTGQSCYIDIFIRCGTYPRRTVYEIEGSRAFTLINSIEVSNTTTSDKLTSTEVYVSVESAATEIHNQAYTEIKDAVDGSTVSYAASAGSATSATKATQDESGNNIKATYASSISISDHTITLKNKNGVSLGTVTVPDNATDNTKVAKSGDTMSGTLTFSTTNAINYNGSKANYSMIRFINNTSATHGNGISIGGGGQTVIGGGESATVMQENAGTSGEEIMYIGNDQNVQIFTGLQNGWDSRKTFTFDTSGALTATKFIGALQGNADSATNVAWSGVTGKPSEFTPSSGSNYYVKSHRSSSQSTATKGEWVSMCNSTQTGSPTLPTTGKWWHVLSLDCWGSAPNNWTSQLAIATSDGNGVWWRRNDSSNTSIDSSTWHRLAEGDASGNATNANKVNNLTVQTAVPANAVFTDTDHTYSLTSSDSSLAIATATSGNNTVWDVGVAKVNGHTVEKDVPSNAVFTDTNTKVTSVGNHYAPSADSSAQLSASASGGTAAWSIDVVQGVQLQRDAKGHVTGVTVTSGKIPANPNTDTKVTVTNTNPTSGTWYYPVWYTGTSGTGGVNANNGFRYYSLEGTTSAAGESYLQLGNSTATGTAGNKRGHLRIYGDNAKYADIKAPASASNNTTHTLPTTGGTILNTGTTSFTQTLTSGTKIGSIKINGTSTDIFAPGGMSNVIYGTASTSKSVTITSTNALVIVTSNINGTGAAIGLIMNNSLSCAQLAGPTGTTSSTPTINYSTAINKTVTMHGIGTNSFSYIIFEF